MVVQRGEPTLARLRSERSFTSDSYNQASATASPRGAPSGGGGPAGPYLICGSSCDSGGYPISAGYEHAFYEDPATINVTDTWSYIKYSYDYTVPKFVLLWPCVANDQWFSASDWHLTDGPWIRDCYKNNGVYYSAQESHFANELFCDPLAWTYNDYNKNHVAGTNLGGLSGWVEASKSGDCSSLLTYHSALVRTS